MSIEETSWDFSVFMGQTIDADDVEKITAWWLARLSRVREETRNEIRIELCKAIDIYLTDEDDGRDLQELLHPIIKSLGETK